MCYNTAGFSLAVGGLARFLLGTDELVKFVCRPSSPVRCPPSVLTRHSSVLRCVLMAFFARDPALCVVAQLRIESQTQPSIAEQDAEEIDDDMPVAETCI